jgi:pimeloyl-ACP methyl ester carboxylesterase
MIKLQQDSFTEPANLHEYDDEPIVIHARSSRVATRLVLFVHGLTGHRYGYWGNTPRFVLEDLPTADVGIYFYRTAWRRFGLFRSIDLEEEARVLADALQQLRLYKAVTIVGHSMGGLLAKAAIVDLVNRNYEHTLRRVAGLVLIACPQLGSLRVPQLLKVFSRDGRALLPHNKTIRRIDTVFTARLCLDQAAAPIDKQNIPTWALVAAEDFWVDALSAGIGVPERQKRTVRGTHGSIISPRNKSADSYVFLHRCLATSFMPADSIRADAEEIGVEDARSEDVPNIRSFAISFFGEEVTPEDVLVQFAKAGGIFRVVKRVKVADGERRERFSGYFCVIPLSVNAAASVKANTLRGGKLTMDHVPASPSEIAALYIGAVAARDHYSRGIVLEALRLHVRYLAALGVQEVLTRPLTEDGLRLVRKYCFRPLEGQGGLDELYVLDVTEKPTVTARSSNPAVNRDAMR